MEACSHREKLIVVAAEFGHTPAREREVLILVCRGCTQPEVAGELGIGVDTVRMHVRKVYWKLGLSSSRHIAPLILRVFPSCKKG